MREPQIESVSEVIEGINGSSVVRRSGNLVNAYLSVWNTEYEGQDNYGMYFVITCDIYLGNSGYRDSLKLGDELPTFGQIEKGTDSLISNFPWLEVANIQEVGNPSGDENSFGGIAIEVVEAWSEYNDYQRQ